MDESKIPKKGTSNGVASDSRVADGSFNVPVVPNKPGGLSSSVSIPPPITAPVFIPDVPLEKSEAISSIPAAAPSSPVSGTTSGITTPVSIVFSKNNGTAPETFSSKKTPKGNLMGMTPTVSDKEIDEMIAAGASRTLAIPKATPYPETLPSEVRFNVTGISEGGGIGVSAASIPEKPIAILPPQLKETKEQTKETVSVPKAGSISDIPTLRTFRQDLAGVVKDQKTSLVRMILEEQKGRSKRELEESPRSRKNLPIILISVLFFLATSGIVYYVFFAKLSTPGTLPTKPVLILSTDTFKEIPVSSESQKTLLAVVSRELSTVSLKLDTTEALVFTKQSTVQTENGPVTSTVLATPKDVFPLLGIRVPDVLERSFKTDFLLGVHAFNKNQQFFVLSVNYYDAARSGMLAWEKTMPAILLPVFGREDKVKGLAVPVWGDMVLQNNDTRILRNSDKSVALIYMFKGENTIIIATNEDTLLKLSTQLDLQKQKVTQ